MLPITLNFSSYFVDELCCDVFGFFRKVDLPPKWAVGHDRAGPT